MRVVEGCFGGAAADPGAGDCDLVGSGRHGWNGVVEAVLLDFLLKFEVDILRLATGSYSCSVHWAGTCFRLAAVLWR